jgi:hypothetical protein
VAERGPTWPISMIHGRRGLWRCGSPTSSGPPARPFTRDCARNRPRGARCRHHRMTCASAPRARSRKMAVSASRTRDLPHRPRSPGSASRCGFSRTTSSSIRWSPSPALSANMAASDNGGAWWQIPPLRFPNAAPVRCGPRCRPRRSPSRQRLHWAGLWPTWMCQCPADRSPSMPWLGRARRVTMRARLTPRIQTSALKLKLLHLADAVDTRVARAQEGQ